MENTGETLPTAALLDLLGHTFEGAEDAFGPIDSLQVLETSGGEWRRSGDEWTFWRSV